MPGALELSLIAALVSVSCAVRCYEGYINSQNPEQPTQNAPHYDNFCLYHKKIDRSTGYYTVQRTHLPSANVILNPNFFPYTAVGQCSQVTVDGFDHYIKICSDLDFCNAICTHPVPALLNPIITQPLGVWSENKSLRTASTIPLLLAALFQFCNGPNLFLTL